MRNGTVLWALLLLLWACAPLNGFAAGTPVMRISLENTESHMQTGVVRTFAQRVNQELEGKLKVVVYSNARLFRDRDAVYALAQGKVEMIVPGTWNIARIEPSVNLFMMPVFYGRSAQDVYALLESPVGDKLAEKIEKTINAKVLGVWLDLGHTQMFTLSRPLTAARYVEGMTIRVAGGISNEMRISALGGLPRIIAWPDLPAWLESGSVDGVLTSYETVASAKLWEYGLRYAFEDNEYFAQYVPIVSARFWNGLPVGIREVVQRIWDEVALEGRLQAAEAQERAKNILQREGLQITVPSRRQVRMLRERVLPRQDEIAQATHVDMELLRSTEEFFRQLEDGNGVP
ncbi:TRAP transporter substrate-binding protein DctP [Oleidesulfovibrio sp.]|uniref:TRAP transporter substrate-binding protein DctP n=1 Tax=Oleidesulfovibrio sp. TaxID=2909707 RepID=UPI003A883ADB